MAFSCTRDVGWNPFLIFFLLGLDPFFLDDDLEEYKGETSDKSSSAMFVRCTGLIWKHVKLNLLCNKVLAELRICESIEEKYRYGSPLINQTLPLRLLR